MNLVILFGIQMNQQRLLSTVNLNLVLLLIVINEPNLSSILQSEAISRTLTKVNPIHPVNLPVVLSHHRVTNELIVDHLFIIPLVSFFYLLKPFQNIGVGYDLVHQVNIENSQRSAQSTENTEGCGVTGPDFKGPDRN